MPEKRKETRRQKRNKAILIFLFIIFIAPITFGQNMRGYGEGRLVWEKTFDIISIKIDSNISGSFFLGSGYIDEEEYYFTFIKDGDNYIRYKTRTDYSMIKEENIKPKLIYQVYSSRAMDPSWGTSTLRRYGYTGGCRFGGYPRWIYIVPVGTIIQKYEIW
jgi:hypothetical protein